jgi:hypothetical protein
VDEPPPRAMGVARPPPKAKPKKISIFFFALGGGRTTPKGRGVAKATPWLTCGGWPPRMGWPATHYFLSFILVFYYFYFLFKNYYFINYYSGTRDHLWIVG